MSTAPAPYPIVLTPLLYDKVWGGDRLAALGKAVKPGARVGESWELADMAATSASGAGGGAARSVIASGPLAGKTLHEAMALWGRDLLGDAQASGFGGFPLLVKFLDAREDLSVQVHPSPAYAASHPEAKLKTECWYILDAQPVNGRPAVIYKGIKEHVTAAQFRAHIADGTVVNDLIAVPAIPGECHNLPSGTCHALGAGVMVAEVQTPSDTTFRVFDWGRTGRALHIEESMQCLTFPAPGAPAATRLAPDAAHSRLVTTAFFTLDEVRVREGAPHALPARTCLTLIALDDGAHLAHGAQAFAAMPLARGSTTVVPAAVSDGTMLSTAKLGVAPRVLVAALPTA